MSDNREYMRVYVLARYHRRRAAATKQLGGKCVKCGLTNDLEFDHIDPDTKEFNIGQMWSVSEKRFQRELKKCQLLCRECHEIKTNNDVGKTSAKDTHGTLSSYRYCKCELCKQAKRDYLKCYRLRKK